MLLNFGDRTRTGAFSMIWPLTRKAARYRRYDSRSILFDRNLRWTTPDGAGLEAPAKQWNFCDILARLKAAMAIRFLQEKRY